MPIQFNESVKSIIGEDGEKLTGPLVKREDITPPNCPACGAMFFNFVEYVSTFQVGGRVAPAMAQSTFPDFDFKSECEKLGRPPNTNRYIDKTVVINDCLDKEASARESAEFQWQSASEDVRAKAMAQLDYLMRLAGVYASKPFYRYLESSLSSYSEVEAAKRLGEKRPGVRY